MPSSRNFGLDVMRSIAIFLVLIGHGSYFLGLPADSFVYAVIQPITFIGVEIFFVLSGFLIGRILIRMYEDGNVTRISILDFWKKRWFRTIPNYYLFLLINIVGFSLFKEDFVFDWRYLFFLQNFISLDESFFSVSWSLSVEEWFYLTLPLLLLLASWRKRPYPNFLVVIGIYFSLVLLLRLLAVTEYELAWNRELRKIVIFRVDSILIGVLTSWFFYRHIKFFNNYRYIFATLSLLSMFITLVTMKQLIFHTKLVQLIFYPCLSIGIALMLPYLFFMENKNNIMGICIKRTSLWSYSLYLSHIPILEAIQIFGTKLGYSVVNQSWGYLTIILWLTISFVASALVYKFWEAPMLSLRDKKISDLWRESSRDLKSS